MPAPGIRSQAENLFLKTPLPTPAVTRASYLIETRTKILELLRT